MEDIRKSPHSMLAKYSKSKCMHVKKAYIKKEVRESLNSKMLPFFHRRIMDLWFAFTGIIICK